MAGAPPALAQGGSVTRVEQDDPSMTYSGNWYSNSGGSHSGGAAALTNTRGARAAMTFTGTGVSWIAHRDEWSGIARVYVDGELKTEIDNYLSPQGHSVAYGIAGLPSGRHTLVIEVTGIRSASSRGSWIWIDAFDVAP